MRRFLWLFVVVAAARAAMGQDREAYVRGRLEEAKITFRALDEVPAADVIEELDERTDLVIRADARVRRDETRDASCILTRDLTLRDALVLVAGVYHLEWTYDDGVVDFRLDPRFDPEAGEILDLRGLEPFSDFGPGQRLPSRLDASVFGVPVARWGPHAAIAGDLDARRTTRERLAALESRLPRAVRVDLRRVGTEAHVLVSSGVGGAVRAAGAWTFVRLGVGEAGLFVEIEDPLAAGVVRLDEGEWRDLPAGLSIRA